MPTKEKAAPPPILYALDFYEAVLQIHVHQELTRKAMEAFHAPECDCPADKGRSELITGLLHIRGVTGVQIDRYTIFILKGAAFSWEEMIDDILSRFLAGMDATGELKRTRPPREFSRNERNEIVYKDKKPDTIADPYRILEKNVPPKNPPAPPPPPA